jgi:hypothetical protein
MRITFFMEDRGFRETRPASPTQPHDPPVVTWAKIRARPYSSGAHRPYSAGAITITAYKKLKEIKQNDKQTIKNLRSAIELFKQNIKSRSQKKKTYALFTALRLSLKKKILRELRGMITFREEIASVVKRYEKQATA